MYLSLVTHYMIGDYKIINLQFYLMTHDWCSPILIIDFMIILISLRMSTCKVKSVGSEYMWKFIAKPEFTWAGRHNFKINFIQFISPPYFECFGLSWHLPLFFSVHAFTYYAIPAIPHDMTYPPFFYLINRKNLHGLVTWSLPLFKRGISQRWTFASLWCSQHQSSYQP